MRKMKDDNGGRDAACSVRFVSYGRMLPPASQCIVSVVLCFSDAARCVPTCLHVYRSCFTLRVGTLRAESVLFPMVGCFTHRRNVLCLLFFILRTQHAASLHVHISIWQYSHISTWQYAHRPTCCNYN